MPEKNAVKKYVENGIYHIYNRGVNKNQIFRSEKDYLVFMRYLDDYLLPKQISIDRIQLSSMTDKEKDLSLEKLSRLSNYFGEIEILAYCLMPNHIHFAVKQKSARSMVSFMKSISVRYGTYFNKKYSRVGHLFQSSYKARQILGTSDLLEVGTYIHLNPVGLIKIISNYKWSSLQYFARGKPPRWLNTRAILNIFNKSPFSGHYRSYLEFVKNEK